MAAELPTNFRYLFITAKEIVKAITFNLPLADISSNGSIGINTSMPLVFNKFSYIFLELENIPQMDIECDNLYFYPDFFGNVTNSKKAANTEINNQLFVEKVELLKSQRAELIFTDGSVDDDDTGFAFFFPRLNHKQAFYNDKTLSSTSAELLAINEALEFAIEYNMSVVAILTDSKAGLLSLMNKNHDNYLVSNIRLLIRNSGFDRVEIHYIPGHSNIAGNEIADAAAREASVFGIRENVKWSLPDSLRHIESTLWSE